MLDDPLDDTALTVAMATKPTAPWLAVLCGPSGSGKSTFAAQLARRTGCVTASADAMRLSVFCGRYPDKDAWSQSRDFIYALVEEVVTRGLQAGFPVVVDGVNSTPEFRHRFLRHAPIGQSLIVRFSTTYDNDDVWAERGYESQAAAAIRSLHRTEFVPPSVVEAAAVRDVASTADGDRLLRAWPHLAG